ncbi:MAG: FAD:protein FMN transferase [Sphingomonadales bacterium]|nr:FAD:protein FMN transferase [Sphingomonadales bacterium]
MGSPCEVQVDSADAGLADRIGAIARDEALRIEAKFSRYRADSDVGRINAAAGAWLTLDAETAGLIDYAAACHAMSDGRFDITSGILRRAWTFDGSDRVPDPQAVAALLPLVGWDKVEWQSPRLRLRLRLRAGMEIDLGGLGKEYAVDRAVALIAAETGVPVLVNFGGDLRVTGPRADGGRWRVLIEAVEHDQGGAAWLEIGSGAITTSGDANRYVLRDGRRYGHILDPRSGMPVIDAPRAVTVAAATCMEAGVLSTLAMLQGAGAEAFLAAETASAWVTR